MFDFLPVLLGSDANVYGMARSFYQQYGVRSVAICKGALVATSNTNLVKIAVLEPDLENDETFVKTLTDYAKAHADKPLVLVSCVPRYHQGEQFPGVLELHLPPQEKGVPCQ